MTTAYTPCNAEGCDRAPVKGGILYRVAPKGQKGPWACAEHVLAEREAWALEPDLDAIAAKVHEAWMETKRAQGVTSRPSEWGEEQMVPYADLTERAKDLDRSTVQAVLAAIKAAGLVLTTTP